MKTNLKIFTIINLMFIGCLTFSYVAGTALNATDIPSLFNQFLLLASVNILALFIFVCDWLIKKWN